MLKRNNFYLCILLICCCFLLSVDRVMGLKSYNESHSGSVSYNCNVNEICLPGSSAWKVTKQSLQGIRVTVVDKNGNRIPGTRSVDFLTKDSFDSKDCVLTTGYFSGSTSGWNKCMYVGSAVLDPSSGEYMFFLGADGVNDGFNFYMDKKKVGGASVADYREGEVKEIYLDATLGLLISSSNYDIPRFNAGGTVLSDLKNYLNNESNVGKIKNMIKETGYTCLDGDCGRNFDEDIILVEPTLLMIYKNSYYYGTARDLKSAKLKLGITGLHTDENILWNVLRSTVDFKGLVADTTTGHASLSLNTHAIGMGIFKVSDYIDKSSCDYELEKIMNDYDSNGNLSVYASKLRALYNKIKNNEVACPNGGSTGCFNVVLGKNNEVDIVAALTEGDVPSCEPVDDEDEDEDSSVLKCDDDNQEDVLELDNFKLTVKSGRNFKFVCEVSLDVEMNKPVSLVKPGTMLKWGIGTNNIFSKNKITFNCTFDRKGILSKHVDNFENLSHEKIETAVNKVIKLDENNKYTVHIRDDQPLLSSKQDLSVGNVKYNISNEFYNCSSYNAGYGITRNRCKGNFVAEVDYNMIYPEDNMWMFSKEIEGLAKLYNNLTSLEKMNINNWLKASVYGLPTSIFRSDPKVRYKAQLDYYTKIASVDVGGTVDCYYTVKGDLIDECDPSDPTSPGYPCDSSNKCDPNDPDSPGYPCVCDPSDPTSPGYPCPSNKFDDIVLFRIIDVNDPFPGLAGLGRETGLNWCYGNMTDETGVEVKRGDCSVDNPVVLDNITNRNNSYNVEEDVPMYSFILTSDTIRKIKEYNDENPYNDYNLECNSDGEECVSEFIDNIVNGSYGYDLDISGSCIEDRISSDWFQTCG